MKFKVDENLPIEATALLREAGHDALHVLDQKMGGQPDVEIARVCLEEDRAIITLDLDFADINQYPPSKYKGILVLRLRRQAKPQVIRAISNLIPFLLSETVDKRLWIVEENRIRVRE